MESLTPFFIHLNSLLLRILHVRDWGHIQTNTPTIMLNKKYADIIYLYYISITKDTIKPCNNITYKPLNKEVKYG